MKEDRGSLRQNSESAFFPLSSSYLLRLQYPKHSGHTFGANMSAVLEQIETSTISEIDLYPVANLTTEFNISPTVLSDRRTLLGIHSVPDPSNGRRKLITKNQYEVLRRLNEHILNKGTGPEFLRIIEAEGWNKEIGDWDGVIRNTKHLRVLENNGTNVDLSKIVGTIEAAVSQMNQLQETMLRLTPGKIGHLVRDTEEEFVYKMRAPNKVDTTLSRLRTLEELAQNKYAIPTSVVLEILDIKNLPARDWDGTFIRYGFKFEPGHRHTEREWYVIKLRE